MDTVEQLDLRRAALRRPALGRGGRIVRSVLAAIARGSDHPVWTTPDARDRALLLSHAQLDRFLNDGRLRV